MYCFNCGKKVDEKAVVCVHCGCELKKRGNGRGIASMVIGIVGLLYTLRAFLAVFQLDSYLDYQTFAYQFGFAIGFVLVQYILAMVSLCLSLTERKAKKTGFNMAGLCLSILTLFLIIIQFIVVVTY